MIKFLNILLLVSVVALSYLFLATNCDIITPNKITNRDPIGLIDNRESQFREVNDKANSDEGTNVQFQKEAQPSTIIGTGSISRKLFESSSVSGAEAKVLHRSRRALAKGRKILLAKAPKPTTTTTTTTTSTTTEATTKANKGQSGGVEAEGEVEYEEEEEEEEKGKAKEDGEEQQKKKDEVESELQKQVSSTKASSVTQTGKVAVAGGSNKQLAQDKKGRKIVEGEAFKGNRSSEKKLASSVSKKKPVLSLPFIKPKNDSICTPEAYLEFPHDLIGNKWRARGLVLIHVAVVCYMFYALALVCERYFMPSLEEFSQRLQLSEDVAGATLMSAGSSAPELFTAILGVFIAKGDVGTGAIVGSAAQLNWWPVLRDSVFYTFTVLVLIVFIYDERVTAYESFAMISLYGVYILIMIHNETIKGHVTRTLLSHPVTSKLISSAISIDGPDDVFGSTSSSSNQNQHFLAKQQKPNYQTTTSLGAANNSININNGSKTVEEDSMFLAAMLVIVQHKRLFSGHLRFQSAARYIIVKRQHKLQQQRQQKSTKCSDEVNYFGPESDYIGIGTDNNKVGGNNQKQKIEAYASSAALSKNKFSIVSKDDYEFWNRPPEEGENYYIWLAKIPVNYVLHYTIPDCTLYPDKYLFTFIISITWTAVFSYIMVWMVTLIGYTFGIPDSVMGVTFLAAGTSIPDCYSSVHAARNGMADMAVSNSIGSNVFDILIGLSLPWFIQTAIYPGVVATINSRGVIYSVILLFLSLIVTIYLMNKYEWTLKPRLGLALLIAYGLFIALTCMLEFNLFGNVNPPPCPVVS